MIMEQRGTAACDAREDIAVDASKKKDKDERDSFSLSFFLELNLNVKSNSFLSETGTALKTKETSAELKGGKEKRTAAKWSKPKLPSLQFTQM
jgi:hypothetical protein